MPIATRDAIISSGNYSNTLFISASNASLGTVSAPLLPTNVDRNPVLQVQDDNPGCVNFAELPRSPVFDIRTNAVEGYRSVLREARKMAFLWRQKRKMSTPAALWGKENQPVDPGAVPTALNSVFAGARPEKSASRRRSMSFNLLSAMSREPGATRETSETFDAILTYLSMSEASEYKAGFHALLKQFCAATTAIAPLFDGLQRVEGMGHQSDIRQGSTTTRPSLIYVLPGQFPINMPRTLQSYLTSVLPVNRRCEDPPRVFLLKEQTLDRKMQRQEGRCPVTGLEIILSGSLRWSRPVIDSRSDTVNIFLEDFKHCRFEISPRTETYESSSSTNASHSSLSNTATTDGEPLTPRLLDDGDSDFGAPFPHPSIRKPGEPDGNSTQARSSMSASEASVKSAKKTPFLRRLFSGDRPR